MEQKPREWRWGKFRWILLAIIILQIILSGLYPPLMPNIQVKAEPLPFLTFGGFVVTNTLVATLLGDIILILLALAVRRVYTKESVIPKGITGVIETLIELIYNQTESSAGKWAKVIFPYFATITLLVLVANWVELFPGVDSIGLLEKEAAHGAKCVYTQVLPGIEAVSGDRACAQTVVPFVRVASTDLNFTIALAIISVFMTQVIGVRAQGMKYFQKFINTTTMWTKPAFGAIDFGVGLLELVSEFSKILSFSFRLFGNIFAGSVLLFVIGSLVPVFLQAGFLTFEFAIGLIQAVVFGMLTMIFMTMATQGHGSEEH